MARRRRGRDVSGILVLDKPQGISSNDAVQKAKRLFNARKVGHTGALDPLATGVLPLCFGEATKFSQYLLSSDKKYWVRIKLGVATDSGDSDGQVIRECPVEGIDADKVEDALRFFRGEIDQVPSMFSAIKHKGQPLYKLARQGIEVEREARRITIYSNQLIGMRADELELEIHCSKGTYVRALARDMGRLLGCFGHVSELRRTQVGPFNEDDMILLDQLDDLRHKGAGQEAMQQYLLPLETALDDIPALAVSGEDAARLRNGQAVIVRGRDAPILQGTILVEHRGDPVALAEMEQGAVHPKRVFNLT